MPLAASTDRALLHDMPAKRPYRALPLPGDRPFPITVVGIL